MMNTLEKFNGTVAQVFIFTLSVFISGCEKQSTHDQLIGQWEIKSWLDSNEKGDRMKEDGALEYFVDFKSDSVSVLEKDANFRHEYNYKWTLNSDSLKVKKLADFRIEKLSENELVLMTSWTNIFSESIEQTNIEIRLIRIEKYE